MANEKMKDVLRWYESIGIDDVIRDNLIKEPINHNLVVQNHDIKKKKLEKLTTPNNMVITNQSLSRIMADNAKNLDDLKQSVMNFENCQLKHIAKNTVFSDGTINAPIMLIGEAPGQSEDEYGIPFCGASGKLLDEILKSIGIFRTQNAYITNCIFWRPPANRRPTEEEIEICRPFVEKHIALINPKLLILVGSTAVCALLGKEYQISKIRKEYFEYSNIYLNQSITTTALFHPAYLLRQPMQKRDTWYDLLKIKKFIEKQ
jgi:uracil-DNA glycosylase family 4